MVTHSQWIWYNTLLVIEHFIGVENAKNLLRTSKRHLSESVLSNVGTSDRGKVFTNKDVDKQFDPSILNDRDGLMNQVLVFKGAAKDWDCVRKWSPQYFADHCGDTSVSLVGNAGLADKENQNTYKRTTVKDYVNHVGKEKHNYLRFSRIIDEDPELRKDVNVDWLHRFADKFSRGGYLYLFMGIQGSRTTMHNAIIQTLFVQIKGKKRWIIYAPNERIFTSPHADRRPYFYSDANPNRLDDPNHPLLKHAICYDIVLEEGDVLWFPAFYWHYVENLTDSIGITYKFTDFHIAWNKSKVLTTLFFLATKPLLLKSFYYNVFKKKDLLFEEEH